MSQRLRDANFRMSVALWIVCALTGIIALVVLLGYFGIGPDRALSTRTWVTAAFALHALGLIALMLLNILPRPTRSTLGIRAALRTFFTYEALVVSAMIMLVPFYWMVITAFKDAETAIAFPPVWTPASKQYLWTSPDTGETTEVRLLGVQRKSGELVPAVPAAAMEFRAVPMRDFTVTREEPAPDTPRIQVDPSTLTTNVVMRLDPRNFQTAWYAPEAATRGAVNFGRYFFVSVFTGILCTLGTLFTSAMAAYAFAKMRFAGRDYFFYLVLVTMMVPGQVLLIPNFLTLSSLGWLDTYAALVVPYLASVFTIFMMRQFFLSIPNDLWEAAQIDGAGRFRFLWQVMVPLSRPVFVTAGIFLFLGNWNALLWPLIVTSSPNMRTLMVGLQAFAEESIGQFHLLMAASTMAILPVVVMFFVLQRFFIQGIARTGLK